MLRNSRRSFEGYSAAGALRPQDRSVSPPEFPGCKVREARDHCGTALRVLAQTLRTAWLTDGRSVS